MIIYCVTGAFADDTWLANVFSTEKLAMEYIWKRKKEDTIYEFSIEERELDSMEKWW